MKTRVIRKYDFDRGVYVFTVQRLDQVQLFGDVWFDVSTHPDDLGARDCARRVSEGGDPNEILAEFGG